MIEVKTYQLLTMRYVQQDAEDFERIYCETIDIAKMATAVWIVEESGVPYQLKWEERSNSHFAMIPHGSNHKKCSVGFSIREHEIKVAKQISSTYPGLLTPAWIDATHTYDYGKIIIKCPTCDNADKSIKRSSHQVSSDYFTHVVSQVDITCTECGARWELYRDGSKKVDIR